MRGKWDEIHPNPNNIYPLHQSHPVESGPNEPPDRLNDWQAELANRECCWDISDPPYNYGICCEAWVTL